MGGLATAITVALMGYLAAMVRSLWKRKRERSRENSEVEITRLNLEESANKRLFETLMLDLSQRKVDLEQMEKERDGLQLRNIEFGAEVALLRARRQIQTLNQRILVAALRSANIPLPTLIKFNGDEDVVDGVPVIEKLEKPS